MTSSGGLVVAADGITTLTQTIAVQYTNELGVQTTPTVVTRIITDQAQLSSALSEAYSSSSSQTAGSTSTVSTSTSTNQASPSSGASSVAQSSNGSFDARYIALIAIIILLVLVIAGILGWLKVRRRSKAHHTNTRADDPKSVVWEKAELPGRWSIFSGQLILNLKKSRNKVRAEMWTDANRHELEGKTAKNLLPLPPQGRDEVHELDGKN